jgi:hypothetical protein
VVDPVDLVLGEGMADLLVERAGRVEVAPERLLDDDPPPGALVLAREPGLAEPPDDLPEEAGRRREVEEDVGPGAVGARDLVQQGGGSRTSPGP